MGFLLERMFFESLKKAVFGESTAFILELRMTDGQKPSSVGEGTTDS